MEEYINSKPHLHIKKILVPVKDKRKLREVLEEHEITSVINIARSRAADTLDPDYASRRAAVDFGIPVCPFHPILTLFQKSLRLVWSAVRAQSACRCQGRLALSLRSMAEQCEEIVADMYS